MKLNIYLIIALLLTSTPLIAQEAKVTHKTQTKKESTIEAQKSTKRTQGTDVSTQGVDRSTQAILDNFAAWDNNLKTLQTDYKQITSFEDTEISSSDGRLYKSGNNIRIDTLEAGKVTQSALTDKRIIKIIDEKGRLITSLTWDDWQAAQANKALFDFGNYAKILKSHKLKKLEKQQYTYRLVFESIPVGTNDVYELEFILDSKEYFPTEISISNEGVKTKTILKDVKKNIEFKEGVFK